MYFSVRATGACETMIKKLYTFYHRLLAPRVCRRPAGRAQSSLASACFLTEGAWSPLAAGRSRVTLLTAGRRKPDRSLCFDTLLRAGHSHDLLRARTGSFGQNCNFPTETVFWWPAGRSASALSSCNCPRTGFVKRRRPFARYAMRPCAF